MRLGLALGYSGGPFGKVLPVVEHADRIGIDSVWSLEEYGTDGATVLAYLAARTKRIKLGTSILQMPARTPANTAMTAMTLDLLSGGRVILGLGLSVPWIVEGWHGVAYRKPLGLTREYIQIVRSAIAREQRLEHAGEHYQIPYRGPGSTGSARPVISQATPLRSRIPIYLASIGSRNVRLAGEIADGWLPAFYSPEREAVMTAPLDEGLRAAGRDPADVPIAVIASTIRADDVGDARDQLRPLFASWIGPKGEGIRNSFFDLACRLGFDGAAHAVRGHYLEGRKADAAAAVPDALLDEVALLGPLPAIVDRLAAWKSSRVDTLILLTRDLKVLEAAQAAL